MNNALQRLYKTKLALLATISTIAGLALIILSRWLSTRPGWAWYAGVINDVSAGLFSIGLLGIFFQYIGAADQEQRDDDRMLRMLKRTVPDFRDAVVDGFAFAPESLTSVASPKTLDRIIENCLAIQLDDAELAKDAYNDLREQVLRVRPRLYDARVSVTLSPWEDRSTAEPDAMFTTTVRWEYRVVPDSAYLRFACVSDPSEYRALLDDPSFAIVWLLRPDADLPASSTDAFELIQCTVDGRSRPSRRAVSRKGQVVTVALGEHPVTGSHPKPVTVAYTYRTVVRQRGHLLHLDISQPTKGLHVEFAYKGCGISSMSVLDYVAGAQQPHITELPPDDPTPNVEIGYDGWVFPKGGVAFVWMLKSELVAGSRTTP